MVTGEWSINEDKRDETTFLVEQGVYPYKGILYEVFCDLENIGYCFRTAKEINFFYDLSDKVMMLIDYSNNRYWSYGNLWEEEFVGSHLVDRLIEYGKVNLTEYKLIKELRPV